DEACAVVAEGDRQSVDLQLGDVLQVGGRLRRRGKAETAPDAGIESPELVVGESVRQRQHGPPMADLAEGARRCRADALRWRIARHERRICRLDRHELAVEL